jgi:cytochrome c1
MEKVKPLYKAILKNVRTSDLYKAKQALAAAGVKRTSAGNISTKKALEAVEAATPFLKSEGRLRDKTTKHRLGAIVASEDVNVNKQEALAAAKTEKEEKMEERRERLEEKNIVQRREETRERNINLSRSERGTEALKALNENRTGAAAPAAGAAPPATIGNAKEAIDVPE